MIATKAGRAGRASTSRIRPNPIANSESTIEATARKPATTSVAELPIAPELRRVLMRALRLAAGRLARCHRRRPGVCGRSGRRPAVALAAGEPTGRGRVGHDGAASLVGGRRLSLDRVPDDDAEVDDRDFQNQQHEDDLPDHALVSLRDRPPAGSGAGSAARQRGLRGRRRMRARRARRRTSSPSLGPRPRPRRARAGRRRCRGCVRPPEPRRRVPPTSAYATMPTAIAPSTNAFRARMRSVPSPPATVRANACAASGQPASARAGAASAAPTEDDGHAQAGGGERPCHGDGGAACRADRSRAGRRFDSPS